MKEIEKEILLMVKKLLRIYSKKTDFYSITTYDYKNSEGTLLKQIVITLIYKEKYQQKSKLQRKKFSDEQYI